MQFYQIIFDFDGVILNSHNIKTRAFYEIFYPYGKKIANQAKAYHEKNQGISRYIKFRDIFKKFLKKKINKNEIRVLDFKFKKICFNKILKLKIPTLLIKFFKNKKKNYNFFISTGTPQKEIEKILRIKKIYKYFKGVYGYPSSKIQHIKRIIKNKKNTLFIGDALEDYYSAKYMKINFILKEHSKNKNILKNQKVYRIKNYKNFYKKLNCIFKKKYLTY